MHHIYLTKQMCSQQLMLCLNVIGIIIQLLNALRNDNQVTNQTASKYFSEGQRKLDIILTQIRCSVSFFNLT